MDDQALLAMQLHKLTAQLWDGASLIEYLADTHPTVDELIIMRDYNREARALFSCAHEDMASGLTLMHAASKVAIPPTALSRILATIG